MRKVTDHRFADRIFPLMEAAALSYRDIMSAARRPMAAPDGMIATIDSELAGPRKRQALN
jgi:predicted nucleic acid-binding protein